MFQETARGRRDGRAGPAPDRLVGTTHLRGSWKAGVGWGGGGSRASDRSEVPGFPNGVLGAGGGVRAEVSLSLLLDPHLHREKSYCVMCQRGFLAGKKKKKIEKCRAAV